MGARRACWLALLCGLLLLACSAPRAADGAPPRPGSASPGAEMSALAPAAPSLARERIVYALPSVSGLFVPPVAAEQLGYFREEGLDVELPVLRANMLAPALLAGEADYAAGLSLALRGSMAGMPIRVVAITVSGGRRSIMALPGIEAPEQLRGQAVAVSVMGDGPHNHATLALEHVGVDPREITWLAMGHSAERLAAMQQGHLAISIFSGAEIPRAEALGLTTVLRLDEIAPLPQAGTATQLGRLERNRDQVKRVARAMVRALQSLRTDREGSVQLFARFLNITADEAEQAYDAMAPAYTPDGTASERSLRNAIAGEAKLVQRSAAVPLADVADFGPLYEALAELGIQPPADAAQ